MENNKLTQEHITDTQPSFPAKGKLEYVTGDATSPKGDGKKLIIHVCNDIGVWGGGFVLAVSKKWKQPEELYDNRQGCSNLHMGSVQFVDVDDDITVANMIAQRDTKCDKNGRPPIRYGALQLCLESVAKFAKREDRSVHAPRFGAGLAGGKWERIEKIIQEELINMGINVTIYDLPVPQPKQVIVMRKKFPVGPNGEMQKIRTGKMVAQGAHASLAVILNAMEEFDPSYTEYEGTIENSMGLFNMPKEWVDWIKGRFTKVCAAVDTEEELLVLYQEAKDANLPCALITDAGLTEFNGNPTNTAIAIGPAMPDKINAITGHLSLL